MTWLRLHLQGQLCLKAVVNAPEIPSHHLCCLVYPYHQTDLDFGFNNVLKKICCFALFSFHFVVCLFVCLFVGLFVCGFVCLFVVLFVCLWVCLLLLGLVLGGFCCWYCFLGFCWFVCLFGWFFFCLFFVVVFFGGGGEGQQSEILSLFGMSLI